MDIPSLIQKLIESVLLTRKPHDQDAAQYDEKHVEIYNPTEQKRIRHVLKDALTHIPLESGVPRALDYGAGTGNLTGHLLDLGVNVAASDVSSKYLERLRLKLGNSDRLGTILLNGDDLSGILDRSFDMVATYSVLHHVPDYLKIIDEFVRVLKTEGIVYIDHEVCPTYWEENAEYEAYLEELGAEFSKAHRSELGYYPEETKRKPLSRKRRRIRKGGDLHVFKDDHIMWDAIEAKLRSQCEIIINDDYLVCREREENAKIWRKWRNKCADMHIMVAKKLD